MAISRGLNIIIDGLKYYIDSFNTKTMVQGSNLYSNIYNTGLIKIELTTDVVSPTGSITILEVNKWYYIVGTFDTNDKFLRLYVNGVLDGISTAVTIFSRLLTNSSNRIGSKDGTTTLPFNGLISNVKIYNKTLSINEILINYNAFKTRFGL